MVFITRAQRSVCSVWKTGFEDGWELFDILALYVVNLPVYLSTCMKIFLEGVVYQTQIRSAVRKTLGSSDVCLSWPRDGESSSWPKRLTDFLSLDSLPGSSCRQIKFCAPAPIWPMEYRLLSTALGAQTLSSRLLNPPQPPILIFSAESRDF